MAETLLVPVGSPEPPVDMRKQRLADLLEGKVEQGYAIQDRTDTEATLVSRGRRRRRWFGVSRSGAELRQSISIAEDGGMTMRKL